MRKWTAWCAVALIGCSGRAAPPSEPATPREATVAAEAPAAAPTSPPPPPPAAREVPPSPPAVAAPHARHAARTRLTAAQRRARVELLQRARSLTRSSQHGEALEAFEAALAVGRPTWREACEAAFVAWRADRIDAAEAHLVAARRGMPSGFVPSALRSPLAMCLFNVGLIHQARGRVDQAREAWTESLRLRANASVQARLDGLPPAPPAEPWLSVPADLAIEAVAERIRDTWCEAGNAGFTRDDLERCSDIRLTTRAVPGGSGDLAAWHVRTEWIPPDVGGESSLEVLVLRTGGAWSVTPLGDTYSPGMDGANTLVQVRPRFDDVLPGGEPELVVEVLSSATNADLGVCDEWSADVGDVILCTTDLGALRCVTAHLRETSSQRHEPCDMGDGELDESRVSEEGYCRSVRFEAGNAVFEPRPDSTGFRDPPFIHGSHPLRELFERGELRFPDTWSVHDPTAA